MVLPPTTLKIEDLGARGERLGLVGGANAAYPYGWDGIHEKSSDARWCVPSGVASCWPSHKAPWKLMGSWFASLEAGPSRDIGVVDSSTVTK